MSRPVTRDAAINIRALPTQRALIDKAAAILGKSRSDFMLEAAYRAAEEVLLDQRFFHLDTKAFAAFNAQLEAPVADNPALRELLTHPAPWEK